MREAAYDRAFCVELVALGKSAREAEWEVRCLAALMLETHFLRIPGRWVDEQLWLAKTAGCADSEALLLRRRLSRMEHLHRRMRGPATNQAAVSDYLHVATQPCRLWFLRSLVDAGEITARILASIRTAEGMPVGLTESTDWGQAVENYVSNLPQLEREVATILSGNNNSYWVAEKTPSEINGLIEYPIGAIVMVIKLPGSDLELEIKRVGLRGPNVLSTRFGPRKTVPWAHRLQGGSMGCTIDNEARGTLRLRTLYEAVHGDEAPISFVLDMQAVHSLPGRHGNTSVLSYFTNRDAFGDSFDEMREAMALGVDAFDENGGKMDLAGDFGLTVRFLTHVAPKQALICGTSSFRLDLLGRYLSAEGPDLYFRKGLKRDYSQEEARQFADDLLGEVLGVYTPPEGSYSSYAEYVKCALQVPANRRGADRTYLSLQRQIGKLWGTLAGLGAYTMGEIFVARNVGLRSRFLQGRWQVRICFMDHDNTWAPHLDCGEFDPLPTLEGMRNDARFIVDETFNMELARGEAGCLRRIYQPGPDVAAAGVIAVCDTARLACRKTRLALMQSEELKRHIDPDFLRSKADWEELLTDWLQAAGAEDTVPAGWEAEARRTLADKGTDAAKAEMYFRAIEKEHFFLSRFRFFYDSEYKDFSRSNWHSGG